MGAGASRLRAIDPFQREHLNGRPSLVPNNYLHRSRNLGASLVILARPSFSFRGQQWTSSVYPILASISIKRFAAALAFQNFLRTFAQVRHPFLPAGSSFWADPPSRPSQTWGVTIAASILQNELKRRLPAEFAAQFPEGIEIAYAAIPEIPTLDEPLRSEVREAFAASLSIVWKAMAGFAGAGLASVFLLKEIPMHTSTDGRYGLEKPSAGPTPPAENESAAGSELEKLQGNTSIEL